MNIGVESIKKEMEENNVKSCERERKKYEIVRKGGLMEVSVWIIEKIKIRGEG